LDALAPAHSNIRELEYALQCGRSGAALLYGVTMLEPRFSICDVANKLQMNALFFYFLIALCPKAHAVPHVVETITAYDTQSYQMRQRSRIHSRAKG
jgi:hypothetical protein